jgi:glycosyltransferase involved in cell wall biosynthesis
MNEALPASNAVAPRRGRAPAVLQVLPSLETGGVERGTCDVAAALTRAGWRAFVASAGGPMTTELERAKARHAELPVDSKNPFVMRANVERLARLIESYHIDIVHARSRAPAWSARAAARRTGRPFVTTFHGTYGHRGALKRRYNSVMAGGDKVIAISDFIAEHIRQVYGIDEERLITIPRGINLEHLDPSKVSGERMVRLAQRWRLHDDMPLIVMPGRLSRWKGQMVLVDALAELGRQDVRCLMLGGGRGRPGYRRALERRIQTKGLSSVVAVIDDCDDMAAAYKLADVVISASTDPEAFGRVAAEAQAMGRPVIATDHGGARETVIDGETGWLVPPADKSALARTIKAALALDVPTREAVAVAARAHIEAHFTVEGMCQATLGVYQSLLDEA